MYLFVLAWKQWITWKYKRWILNLRDQRQIIQVRKDFIVSLTNNHRLVHLRFVGADLDPRSNVGQIKKKYSIDSTMFGFTKPCLRIPATMSHCEWQSLLAESLRRTLILYQKCLKCYSSESNYEYKILNMLKP